MKTQNEVSQGEYREFAQLEKFLERGIYTLGVIFTVLIVLKSKYPEVFDAMDNLLKKPIF